VFLGFFLFQSTAYLFENWLRSMISFSVQVVVVLAIIVFWIMSINQFVGFFNDLSKLIYPFEPIQVTAGVWSPSNGWGICDPIYGTDSNTGEPTAKCRSGFNAYPPTGVLNAVNALLTNTTIRTRDIEEIMKSSNHLQKS